MKNLIIISVFIFLFSNSAFAQSFQEDFLKINRERLVQIEKEQGLLMMRYLMPLSEQETLADAYNVLENEKYQIFILQDIYGIINRITFNREKQERNSVIPYEPAHQMYNGPHRHENDIKKRIIGLGFN